MKRAARKVCIGCKWRALGTIGRMEWCDRCGGEMRPIRYGRNVRKRKT